MGWSPSITGEDASSSSTEEIDITEETRRVYEKNVERFKEEYQTLVKLKHPNVAEVHKIGFFDGHLYIVSEFIVGKPLAEYLRGREPAGMVRFFVQALEGLDYIHRNGLIHLDIKSQNVLVQETGGEPRVKIIDFGMAMKPSEYGGNFMGTPSYIAPEVALGKRELVDSRADLFSFGVLMYYCITWGSHPFARPKDDTELLRRAVERRLKPPPPSRSHSGETAVVPEYLDTITMRLLEHEPKDRFYGSARAIINALATKMPDAFCENPETKSSYLRPMGDRHIGNEREQAKVFAAIDALAMGEMPSPAVTEISGAQGTGKSHLLKKIKEHAEKHAERLAIKKIDLPADEAAVKKFSEDVTLWASENKQPAVVLIDNIPSPLMGEGQGEGDDLLELITKNILNSISERETNPKLYSGIKPLMLVFTKDCHSEASCLPAGRQPKNLVVSLHPFTPAELKEYLSSTPAFKGRDVPDKKIMELHSLTGGIQAEVVARLRESDSEGLIFNLDGEIIMSDFKRREKPPATTEARLTKIYESLTPDERRILDFLSVWSLKNITPPPDFETISHLVPSPFTAVCVNNLVQNGLSFLRRQESSPTGFTYSFANPYFSTFIHDRMDENEKLRWHDAIARHLSFVIARRQKGDEAISSALLLHQGLGSDKRLALKSIVKLAKAQLYDKGRADFAAWTIERALPLVDDHDVKLKSYILSLLAEAKIYEGNYTEAEKNTVRGLSLIQAANRKMFGIETHLQMWHVFSLIGQRRHTEAAEILDNLLQVYEQKKNTIFYLLILNLKAQNFYSQSFTNPLDAVWLLENSYKIYRESKSLETKIPSQNARLINSNNIGVVLRVLGNLSEAVNELEGELSNKEHTVFSRMAGLFALAETHRMLGRYEKAETIARKALKIASQCGQSEWIMHAHGTIANIYHDMDRFDDAIEEDRRYLSASSCIEDEDRHRRTTVRLWVHMGHCYKEKKDHDLAILHFEAAIEAGAKGFELMSAHLGIGESNHRKGKLDEAKKHLSKAKELLDLLPGDASVKSHLARIEKLQKEIGFGKGVS